MQKKLIAQKIVIAIIGSLLATSSFAGPKHRGEKDEARETRVAAKEESIGLGSGAAIGAMAGGPIGLVLGAAFGGWLGDRFHHEHTGRLEADQRAAQASAHSESLQTRLATSERVVAEKNAELFSERVAHRRDLQEALSIEVFFRTEESGLAGSTDERIAKLAALIEPMDGAVIRLDGHTDARGTETYNSTLSTARAEAVRDALIRGGMPAERVIVTGSGETTSTAGEKDTDGMALERRVEMNVVDVDGAGRVAEVGTR